MTAPAVISNIAYGWETSYGVVSTSINKAFGSGVKVTNLNRKNNMEQVWDAGLRNAAVIAPKRYEGTASVEWVLANPWFFQALLSAPTTSGSGPYTHTFAEADTVPSFSLKSQINSTTAEVANLLGAKMGACTISSAVNELVRCKADIPYANEAFSTTTSARVAESETLFTFAQATLELPTGSTLAMVQNFDFTINNNPEIVYGQGSRVGQEATVKNRAYTGNISMALQQSGDLLTKFFGGSTGPATTVAEAATMKFTFTNGLTSTNLRSIVATFTGIQLDEDSIPQDPTQNIMEDCPFMARSLSVVATNNTSAAP